MLRWRMVALATVKDMSLKRELSLQQSAKSIACSDANFIVVIRHYPSSVGGVPPSGVRAEGVGFAVEALQGLHGGRDQEVIGELR